LPKRYKAYIFALEERLHSLQSMADAEDESLVWLEAYAREVSKRHLPSDARVCFKLTGGEIEVRIDKRRGGEALEISSSHGRLLLLPDISNQIGVKVGRHE
jgi:hypothetical protein